MTSRNDGGGENWPGPGTTRNPTQQHAPGDKNAQTAAKTTPTQGGGHAPTSSGKVQHQRTKSGSSADDKATRNAAGKAEKKPEAAKNKPSSAKPAQGLSSTALKATAVKTNNNDKSGERPGSLKADSVTPTAKADTAASKTAKPVTKQELSQRTAKADGSRAGSVRPSDHPAKSATAPKSPAEKNPELTSKSTPKDTKLGGNASSSETPKRTASKTEEKVGRQPPPIPARTKPAGATNREDHGSAGEASATNHQPGLAKQDTKVPASRLGSTVGDKSPAGPSTGKSIFSSNEREEDPGGAAMSGKTPGGQATTSNTAGRDEKATEKEKVPAAPSNDKDEKSGDVMNTTAGKLGAPNPAVVKTGSAKGPPGSAVKNQDGGNGGLAKDGSAGSERAPAPAKESGKNGSAKTVAPAKESDKNSATGAPTAKDGIGSGGDRGREKHGAGEESTGDGVPTWSGPHLTELAQRGDWNLVDQAIRGMVRGHPELSRVDQGSGTSLLMLAVRENRLVITERLLELGASVNEQTKDGRTALHYAASYAKEDMVKLLLSRKADATIVGGSKSQLALHIACTRGSGVLGMVQSLLRNSGKDARLLAEKSGLLPIFLAADTGSPAVCRELLQQQPGPQISAQKQDNGDTLLHVACRKKDYELVKLFLESRSDVDAQNNEGHTPLHISASEGDETVIKLLHQFKANANISDKLDRSPLHIAAEKGFTSIVELLVDKFRANISARTKDGSTLMHIASQYGHPETAMVFLKKGVPLHMPNKGGAICLHAAAMKGHVSVIKSLLQKGASVDVRTKDNYTALHVAVEYGKPLAVQTLLGFGANVEFKGGKVKETPLHIAARVKDGEKCAEMLLKSGADVNATQENGETALHIAARNGLLKICQALLGEGADPMWQSKAGETALHIAVRYCHWEVADELVRFVEKTKSRIDAIMLVNQPNSEGETTVHCASELTKQQAHHEFEDTDIMRLLLEYNGDINIHTRLTQETPLHYCARAGNADVLLEIVKHIGPNMTQTAVNKQAKNGWSPLLVASEQGHLEITRILIKNNARVDVFDEHGKAALHLAAESGHEAVADTLLLHRAFVNAKSKLGVTPLHLASQNGYSKLVNLLLEKHHATIDALSLAKKTPLHMAAQSGQMEVCSTLLRMKADASAKDAHDQTPLHLAAENDHSDVVKLFLKHRAELVTMANTDENGMTCAHIAASKGSVAVIKELMKFNKTVVTTARDRISDSTSLHLAAAGGHAEVVKVLLEAGASATDENADGTAIHLAAKHGHINVLEALNDKVSWKVTSSKSGFTALHVAAHYGQIDFVREMLSRVPATVRSEPPHTADGRDIASEYGLTPLHLAAQSGHEGLVRLLLNSPGVQADAASNVQGSIPLHLAAQSGHTAVVSLLLSKSTSQLHVKDKRGRTGLHLAAANGHLDMVSLLLGQGADIDVYDKSGWTPLHFAAKAGHLPVVKLLTEGGANPKHETKDGRIPVCFAASASHAEVLSYLMKRDHDTHTLMEDKKFVFDLMVVSSKNNNLSIREFILTSHAPVETAVKLSKNFRLLATKEKERARDLFAAGNYCEAMATELNAIAASENSAGQLLKSVDSRGIPFLDVLIECEQKQVVSHPSVQKYLSDVWTGHLSHWAGWKMIMLFCALLFIPPVWLAFSLPLKHRYNKVPVIKFMSYLVSHIYLIVLYVLTVVYPLYQIWESSSLLPHWYEWLLLAWLSGLLVSQLTNPEDRAGLGWIKVIVIAISSVGVCIHLLAFAFEGNERLECLYVRNQFFAFALMLCFVQMMDFLSFHHLFGPWAIIIRDLMKDLTRFLVILCIFMIGFTLHLAAIYQPVTAPLEPSDLKGDGNGSGGSPVETPFDTFELLFFALFGLVEPENLPPVHRNPVWTLTLAKAVFGVYLIVTLIVLINLLIAMMSDTYQRIQAQSDTEWKFGRAKLFRNMNKTSATPSPLNLFTKLFTYCKILFKHKGKVCTMNTQSYIDEEEELDTHFDHHSNDLLGHTNWMRTRRNTQVAPESGFLRSTSGRGPVPIEKVVDWQAVGEKYIALSGGGNGQTEGIMDVLGMERPDDLAEAMDVNEKQGTENNSSS